jgi:ribosomal protein S18 acetylase RimI-like enzyme
VSASIKAVRPDQLNSDEKEEVAAFVIKYGDIPEKYVRDRVKGALTIVRHFIDNALVGAAVIKCPSAKHRNGAFEDSCSTQNPNLFGLELGYIAVHCDYRRRGIGSELIKSAMEAVHGKRVFATTRENNDRIHRRLENHGFVREGDSYRSKEGDYQLVLFVGPT